MLGDRKSLNVPGVHLNIPFISEQDDADIRYACNHEGDFLALSFVSTKEDVMKVKDILKECDREDIKIISKIESTTGVDNLIDIINVSDGIMVARGDLGVEVPIEQLPIIQKKIVKECRNHGKICVVATEMLETMKKNARPTRAEVSDVANAVLDGTDAVMLSGETTMGKFPVETVSYMAKICEETEKHITFNRIPDFNRKNNVVEMTSINACLSANNLDAKLIVLSTMSGYTARKISNIRPNCLVLAQCMSESVARSLSLYYGVYTIIVPTINTTDEMLELSINNAKKFLELKENDIVIVAAGSHTLKTKGTNLLKIETI